MHSFSLRFACSLVFCGALGVGACSSTESTATDGGTTDAGELIEGAQDASVDAHDAGGRGSNTDIGQCASAFGNALTEGFGRIDGTLVAIVRPVDQQCAQPNGTHVILQVQMNGAVYRLVVNIESTRSGQDPRVRLALLDLPLPAPAWQEGWHTGLSLDYATNLEAHDAAFSPMAKENLVSAIVGQARIGEQVSVYGVSGAGRPESAHLIHRNDSDSDGAIVFGAASTEPRFLLFAFDGQSF